ncbi:MAG: protein kinase, partial [Gemmatimonadetes bacterium]|nr:protein kinase [Gemmatimonadota bacterium]
MSGLEGLLAGKVLVNRYRIGEVIGRGGFAAVYRADDERLGRTVAVKVITLAAPDPDAQALLRERFQREARSAAALPQHPNVVTVYDFGTDPETGIDFLVMELLRGEDLASRLAREPRLPLELATCIVREAAEGLAVGHRAGLVHRDVKPGNVFLGETQGDGPFRVCVVDFGIARVAAEEATAARLTQAGDTPLSPAYASPEQLRGDADLTPASDVFSLGVVAYQLFTGERPFPAERRRGPGGWDVGSVAEKNPELPPAVAAAVQRALAFDAGERWADAGAFGAALDEASGRASAFAPAEPPLVMAPEPDETIRIPRDGISTGGAAAAGAFAGAAAAGAGAFDDDDRTLLNVGTAPPVSRSAPAPVPDVLPVGGRADAGPRLAPVAKRPSRAVPIALFAALVLAGGGAMAAYVGHGKGGKDSRAPASDTASSAPTTTTAPGGVDMGGGAASPSPATAGAMDTGGSLPVSSPTLDAGASGTSPAPAAGSEPAPSAGQPQAPTAQPSPSQPAPQAGSAPAPPPARPSTPAPARPSAPAAARP